MHWRHWVAFVVSFLIASWVIDSAGMGAWLMVYSVIGRGRWIYSGPSWTLTVICVREKRYARYNRIG